MIVPRLLRRLSYRLAQLRRDYARAHNAIGYIDLQSPDRRQAVSEAERQQELDRQSRILRLGRQRRGTPES